VKRALTAASRVQSRTTGESPRESLISTSEDAFIELTRMRPALTDPRSLEFLAPF